MKIPLPLALPFAAIVSAAAARADVTLAPLFTDHAVLQRDQPVPVWGTADAGESVTVTFAGQSVSTAAIADGAWSVKLAPISANAADAPLTVRGKNTITLSDILVGDVWLCGGQSNMEWPLRLSNDAETEAAAASYPLIRHIKIARQIARDPITAADGEWTVCSPETAPNFTAVGYYFARDVYREIGVPIGLVNSNWGGTPVEAWLPPSAMTDLDIQVASASHQAKSFTDIHNRFAGYRDELAAWNTMRREAEARGNPFEQAKPTPPWTPGAENCALVLNNGMIAPLAPFALRGVIWYQDESNADQPETYRELFGALIKSWRSQFNQPDLSFFWVQLANFAAGSAGGTGWAFLREAQTQTLSLPQTGQAVIYDIGEAGDIHPRNKKDVDARLAHLALARTYGREIEDSGPTFASATFDGSTARVEFNHAAGLATTDGAAPLGFEVAGSDGVFHTATARLDGRSIILTCPEVPKPLFARYAWRNHVEVNLVNSEGLPAAPFRTDRF